jgi:dolichyl-phosphate-mannose--protein O-mannosyl transferase
MQEYEVSVRKKAYKNITKAPQEIQILFDELIDDLQVMGPIQTTWPKFSKLEHNKYHCHLAYSWVTCWYWEKGSIEIEVYYAGSRENAPY